MQKWFAENRVASDLFTAGSLFFLWNSEETPEDGPGNKNRIFKKIKSLLTGAACCVNTKPNMEKYKFYGVFACRQTRTNIVRLGWK